MVGVVSKRPKKATSVSYLDAREVVMVAARHGFTVSLCPGSEVRKSMRMEGKTGENNAPFASWFLPSPRFLRVFAHSAYGIGEGVSSCGTVVIIE